MDRGSFYAFVPQRNNIARFIPLKKNKNKAVNERLEQVHTLTSGRSWKEAEEDGRPTRITFDAGNADVEALQDVNNARSNPTDFLVPGGGLVVVRTSVCTPEHPHPCVENTYPSVYCTGDSIVAFSGNLGNIEELLEDSNSGLLFEYDEREPGAPVGSQMRSEAEVIYHLYKRAGKSSKDDLLVMLSELQGRFAFFVYDAEENCAFAARDPSGDLGIYYQIDGDGGIAITNSLGLIGAMESDVYHVGCGGGAPWQEIPAGHFTVGRHQRPTQFALNSRQLETRQENEDDPAADNDSIPSSPLGMVGTPSGTTPGSSVRMSAGSSFKNSSFKADVQNLFDKVSGSLSRKNSGAVPDHLSGEFVHGVSDSGGGSDEPRSGGLFKGGIFGSGNRDRDHRNTSSSGSGGSEAGAFPGAEEGEGAAHPPAWDVQLPPMSDCVEWSAPKREDEIDSASWKDLAPGIPATAC